MRIVPIRPNSQNYINNRKSVRKSSTSAANDFGTRLKSNCNTLPFQSSQFIRQQLQDLKDEIDESLMPYAVENRGRYNQVCKIGYNAQEKVNLINDCEQNLFQKKFSNPEDEVFSDYLKKSQAYNNHKNNIERFEFMVKTTEENGFMTPKIQKYIHKNRPKMYKYSDEFEKLKPVNDKFCEVYDEMNGKLSEIKSTDNENFYNSVKNLRDKHLTAVCLAIFSGISDIDNVRKKTENFERDNSDLSYYESEKQLNGLYFETARLKESIPKFKNFVHEADKFISDNKGYETAPPSVQTINDVYSTLYEKTDEIKENAVQRLLIFNKEHPSFVSEQIKNKTFKFQAEILTELDNLICEERYKS